MSLLIVSEEGVPRSPSQPGDHAELRYRFTGHFPGDGLAGWASEPGERVTTVDVAAYCRDCDGGFRHQALNRFLAQAIIRQRPAAVVVYGLWGCTVDLPRIAQMMGVPSALILGATAPAESYDESTQSWLQDAMVRCRYIVGDVEAFWGGKSRAWLPPGAVVDEETLFPLLQGLANGSVPRYDFSYSTYEFVLRDHPLMAHMQQADTAHFSGLDKVLDVACGAGIFLDCLRRSGIGSMGVERDPVVADYARGMGLNVITRDAMDYLENAGEQFDGIYCSHFVEHLQLEPLQRLLQLLALRLRAGGALVMVFPDPESIRSQLLAFWRDPEHVRFYHHDLIASMAATLGLELEWTSHEEQPHSIVAFPDTPPPMPATESIPVIPAVMQPQPYGPVERVLRKLGLVTEKRLLQLEDRLLQWGNALENTLRRNNEAIATLEERTDTLWDVNQTWSWNDNVTIRLRKRDN